MLPLIGQDFYGGVDFVLEHHFPNAKSGRSLRVGICSQLISVLFVFQTYGKVGTHTHMHTCTQTITYLCTTTFARCVCVSVSVSCSVFLTRSFVVLSRSPSLSLSHTHTHIYADKQTNILVASLLIVFLFLSVSLSLFFFLSWTSYCVFFPSSSFLIQFICTNATPTVIANTTIQFLPGLSMVLPFLSSF